MLAASSVRPVRRVGSSLLSVLHSQRATPEHSTQRRCVGSMIDLKTLMQLAEDDTPASPRKNKSYKHLHRVVDKTRIRVEGGSGGRGNTSMQRVLRSYKLKPDGGHGGRGGSVVIMADPQQQSLNMNKSHFMAPEGSPGGSQECTGRDGSNIVIRVPCGVVVKQVMEYDSDAISGSVARDESVADAKEVQTKARAEGKAMAKDKRSESVQSDTDTDIDLDYYVDLIKRGVKFEIDITPDMDASDDSKDDDEADDAMYTMHAEQTGASDMNDNSFDEAKRRKDNRPLVKLADLDQPGSHVVVARGGSGGLGSCRYASWNGPLPDATIISNQAQPLPGEVAYLELELKTIADVGLVGFPNAGKSSLLRAMSRATPEVAPYPFTTLHPLVGAIEYRDGYKVKVADIPGLIQGASYGRGKGFDFLRHVERTKALLYIVDAASVDYRDPLDDLRVLAQELEQYNDGSLLSGREALVVANKVDLLSEKRAKSVVEGLQAVVDEVGIRTTHDIFCISAGVTGYGLSPLSKAIRGIVESYDLLHQQHGDGQSEVSNAEDSRQRQRVL
jgi:Obg family GTPase CgtA